MRRITALFALLVLAACSVCCRPSAVPTANAAERAEAMSVALASIDEDGEARADCGGVWIDQYTILTAFHCVADLGRPPVTDLLEQLLQGLGDSVPPELRTWTAVWDPTGQPEPYFLKGDKVTKRAVVAYFDRKLDLALLEDVNPPPHAVAHLGRTCLRDGEEVDVVGSPSGFAFSYSHGYISSTIDGAPGKQFKTLEIAAPIWFGNSGGGAFDANGDLAGIADYMASSGHGVAPMGFFIHRDVVRDFLHAYHEANHLP